MTCECKNKVTVNANGKKYVVCKDCYKIHYEDFLCRIQRTN